MYCEPPLSLYMFRRISPEFLQILLEFEGFPKQKLGWGHSAHYPHIPVNQFFIEVGWLCMPLKQKLIGPSAQATEHRGIDIFGQNVQGVNNLTPGRKILPTSQFRKIYLSSETLRQADSYNSLYGDYAAQANIHTLPCVIYLLCILLHYWCSYTSHWSIRMKQVVWMYANRAVTNCQ